MRTGILGQRFNEAGIFQSQKEGLVLEFWQSNGASMRLESFNPRKQACMGSDARRETRFNEAGIFQSQKVAATTTLAALRPLLQ